jgi:hypothetical protein
MRIRNRNKASQLGDDTRCEVYVSSVRVELRLFLGSENA